jgi:hypothetical protein
VFCGGVSVTGAKAGGGVITGVGVGEGLTSGGGDAGGGWLIDIAGGLTGSIEGAWVPSIPGSRK